MYKNLRSILFKLDPETAHTLAIKSLKYESLVKNNILNNERLEVKVFNKKLPNPIGMAAGFDKDAEIYNSLYKLGFGFVEVGTVTPKSQFGNTKPRVFRLEEDEALINRLGFNNSGSEKVLSRILKNNPKGFFGINIGPNKNTEDKVADYLECFKKFYDVCDYITINISSPNTENLRNFHNQDELKNLLKQINVQRKKLKPNLPICVKISPDISDNQIDMICDILLNEKIDAINISNSSDSMRGNLKNANRLEKGGLSGKPIEIKSNILIKKFYKSLNGKIKIIGTGGIDSGLGALEKIKSGASMVQLYTGMVFKGPNIAYDINKQLLKALDEQGFKSLKDAIGSEI